MRRRDITIWILEKFRDLVIVLMKGDRVAIAILLALIAGGVVYWFVALRRKDVPAPDPEDRWIPPGADEVARVVGPPRGGSEGGSSEIPGGGHPKSIAPGEVVG